MSQHDSKLRLEDIQAFFDGKLNPERTRELVSMIKENPDVIRRLADYAAQNDGMHYLFDFVLNEPIPDRMLKILENYEGDTKEKKSES